MPHEMSRFALMESPVEKVWSAITEPSELKKWFCTDADIDLREGGRFHLESTGPNVSGKHRVVHSDPNRYLHLEWMLAGHPTNVSLVLENFRGITRITVRHQVPDDFPESQVIADSSGSISTGLLYLWGYALILLKSYLRDSETQMRLDEKTDPLGIEWETTIAAEPSQVFKALVDPEKIKKWNPYCGPDLKIEPEAGGRYSFGWPMEDEGTDGPERIVEFKDGHKISYTWHGKETKTLVTWTVEPVEGKGTKLHFTHSGFLKDPKIVLEYKLGWAHFIYAIKMLVETNQTANDWMGDPKEI